MKYRVVGWTHYDNPDVESVTCDEAGYWAIVRDIREHGYEFTGWEHQEADLGAPVLNDGRKRLFSQRDFGQIMAYAHGDYTRMGYVSFAFPRHPEQRAPLRMPSERRRFDPTDFTPEGDLREELVCTLDRARFDAAVASEKLCLPFDTPELETIGSDDTLTLCCGDSRETFGVASAVRGPALSEEEDMKIFTLSCSADLSKMEQADALFNAAPWKIEITLSRNPISEGS